jgi:hypothetical protein
MRAGHEEMMAMLGAHHERMMFCLLKVEAMGEEMEWSLKWNIGRSLRKVP